MTRVPVTCLSCGTPYILLREDGSVVQRTVCPRCGAPGWEHAATLAVREGRVRRGVWPQRNPRIPRRSGGLQPRSCVPMSECAIIWRESRDPDHVYAGGLTLDGRRALFRGSAAGVHVAHEIGPDDIAAVERVHGAERLAGRPSLRVALRNGASLLIAGVAVGGSLGVLDVADALVAMTLRAA